MVHGVSWDKLILFAGVGQLILVAASLAIPRTLRWREDTAKLRPLTREIFWTYAAYIWTTNLCFGLLSTLAPHWLLDGSPLATVVSGFIAVYWGARLILQFAYFDRAEMTAAAWRRLAEIAAVGLFGFLTLVYGGACLLNLRGGGP